MKENFDIFISYRNDGEGELFASQLKRDLTQAGFSVYFNETEKHSGSFPERLKAAIINCKDFLLVLSEGCINGLIANEKIDWVREEINCASENNKNIIPILIGKAAIPLSKGQLPEGIRFIEDLEAILLPKPVKYLERPFNAILSLMKSEPLGNKYEHAANLNDKYNTNVDFNITLEKAKQNDFEAMYEIACMYLYGYASKDSNNFMADYFKAAIWLKRLINHFPANEKIPDYVISAKTILANLYYKGLVPGEDQSYEIALKLLVEAERDAQNSTCNFDSELEKIIYFMMDGIGTNRNIVTDPSSSLRKYFESLETSASKIRKHTLSLYYLRSGMYVDAVRILKQIKDNNPMACYRLGTIYLHGLHTETSEPNVSEAARYFMQAKSYGHLDALYALGRLNFYGQYGYEQNYAAARELFKEGAERGHSNSQYHYAYMCKYGLGGEKDLKKALYYFEEAAQKGNLLCRKELALIYQEEECRDYKKAFDWAEKTAAIENSTGEFLLGNFFFFGRGCEPNYYNALKYYKKALDHGFYPAKFMIEKINKIYNLE